MSQIHQAVVCVGRCIGCDVMARLDEGVCEACLHDPKRGRRWAEMSHRVRTDLDFARYVYARIPSASGRALFRRMYGAAHAVR